jgi:hypothetical protein
MVHRLVERLPEPVASARSDTPVRRSIAVAGVLVLTSLGGCGTNTNVPVPSASVVATASPTELVPALTATAPTVTIRPDGPYRDGEVISVSVGGFGVGSKIWLSECASSSVASDLGCGAELAAQPFLVTTEDGSGTGAFTIASQAADQSLRPRPAVPCADRCVIVATLGSGYPFAMAPISVR